MIVMAVSLVKRHNVINVACAMVVDNRSYDTILREGYAEFLRVSRPEDDITPQMYCFTHLSMEYARRDLTQEDYTEVAAFLTKFYHQVSAAFFMSEFHNLFGRVRA
jgi:hypothetical protein